MSTDPVIHRFGHHAMATVFEVLIADEESAFAAQAAQAAFDEVDRLEQDLSRYRPNSDITRINNLPAGGTAQVSADTFACLQLAQLYWRKTGGAFDITMGALMDCWIAPDKSLFTPTDAEIAGAAARCGMDLLTLDESTHTVRIGDHVPCIDPGAIGKGYAVDVCLDLLLEWGVDAAFMHGGTSTAAGYGRAWPVTASSFMHPERVAREMMLDGMALSGSGIRKGRHIIDPRTCRPVAGRNAAWVCLPSATASDALSTALMVMTADEIAALATALGEMRALVMEPGEGPEGERVISYGWESAS